MCGAQHLNRYRRLALDDQRFSDYLDEYVFSMDNHEAYLKKIGDEVLGRIRAVPPYGYTPGLERG